MTKEFAMDKTMSKEQIRELVAKAVCEGIELTPGDFDQIEGRTIAIAEHAIQMNYLRANGFEEKR